MALGRLDAAAYRLGQVGDRIMSREQSLKHPDEAPRFRGLWMLEYAVR